jgi:hypothetical protein
MTETRGPNAPGDALEAAGGVLGAEPRLDVELRDADDPERRLPGGGLDDAGLVPVPGVGDEVAVTRSGERHQPQTACYAVVRRRIGDNLEGEAHGVPLRAWVVLWVRPGAEPA